MRPCRKRCRHGERGRTFSVNESTLLLEAQAVSRAFAFGAGLLRPKRTLLAVDGVSFRLSPGEAVAIVGESGCGKTTLARMLLGLLAPTAGTIRLDGRPVGSLDRREIARLLQPVFQDPYGSLNPRKPVGEIIALPLRVQRDPLPATWRSRVEAMMERVGLQSALYGRYPSELSGGQRQRVAIARALIHEPRMLVCDEPTSALDVSVQAQILNLLQDLQRDLALGFVLISHNLAVVRHMSQRVTVMYLGRVVETGETMAVFEHPRHPYTQALLDSVLSTDPGTGIPDVALGGATPDPLDPPTGCTFHPRCPQANDRCRRERPELLPGGTGSVACHAVEEGRLGTGSGL
jgi:peptide/nickel transport system ATP-binding protein